MLGWSKVESLTENREIYGLAKFKELNWAVFFDSIGEL